MTRDEQPEERGERPTPASPNPARIVAAALLGLLGLGAGLLIYDLRTVKLPAPHVFAATQQLRVDEPGLYYLWMDANNQLQSTRDRARTPTWSHTLTEVWHPLWGPRPEREGGYIVDLSEAKSGDVMTATLRSRAYIWQASHAADAGEATAQLTTFLAREIAVSHPTSLRAIAAEQTLKQLEILDAHRPPTHEETMQAFRERLQARQAMLKEAKK